MGHKIGSNKIKDIKIGHSNAKAVVGYKPTDPNVYEVTFIDQIKLYATDTISEDFVVQIKVVR